MALRRLAAGAIVCSLCSGCAAVSPVQVGQTAGTIAGSMIAPGVGAPIGALAGLLAGMVIQGQVDKVVEKRERKELGQELGKGPDAASEGTGPPRGQQTRVWVDETVQNGRRQEGHFDTRYL